ncbi:hypothetical protein JKF63_01604 [Porcisia hertigi]|uniref:J domain-containing protein n=1 Tax=Porcisia hertigi TaxID=2761500 RepID=A0A836HWH7_9TRYP|nr:hypothetical protein JKF63_01604 [Porcisia hertigi]
MEGCMAKGTRGLSAKSLESNSDFRRFAERMRIIGRVYTVKSQADSAPRVVAPPQDEEEAMQGNVAGEWLDCCLREYLERKRLFEHRFRNRAQLILRILALLVPFLALLWYIWPLWRVLFDVEADAYKKVLEVSSSATSVEITRAYRALMKRWHPDHNPNCGQFCREKTESIKEAYNVLLSRGEHGSTLANEYHKSLMTLRSFLSFRGLQMSGDAAMNIFLIFLRLRPSSARSSATLRLACGVVILVFCTVYETLFISGFSIVTIIQFFYYSLSIAKASAQQQVMNEVRRNSYFDVVLDASVFLGCASVASFAVWGRGNAASTVEEAFRMMYGSVYVLSFLYNFSPNVYDNFLMRKYSLPLSYVDMNCRFTWIRFAKSELMFFVDDLFVFTCRISSSYRVVVYVAHFVSLCQFFMLPWDAPAIKRGAIAGARAGGLKESTASAAPSAKTRVAQSTSTDATQAAQQSTFVESYITREEAGVVADLDREKVEWLDVANMKYQALVLALDQKHARQRGHPADAVCIAPSANLQEIVVVAFSQGAGTNSPASQGMHYILGSVHDPEMSQLVAMERGPKAMVPSISNLRWNLDLARVEYHKVLGHKAPLTISQLWRKRAPGSPSALWGTLVMMVCTSVVVALVCAVSGPSAQDISRSSARIDSSLRPQLYARFLWALPPNHFANAFSAGLLTIAQIPLCTLDWWDAGATLGFLR